MSWPVPERREKLLALYRSGATFREIAAEYGGTPSGVRSTIRKMREREDPLAMPVTKVSRLLPKMHALREQGLRKCEIAERLGIHHDTVGRVL